VNLVDPILLVILFLFGLRGYFKGLFREVFSLAGLVGGFVIAARYDGAVAAFAANYWNPSSILLKAAAFVAVFFLVYFLFNLTGWLIHRSSKALFLHTVNRFGGIAIGVGKGAALGALALFLLLSASWAPASAKHRIQTSYLGPPLSRLAEGMIRIGKERFFSGRSEQAEARTRLVG